MARLPPSPEELRRRAEKRALRIAFRNAMAIPVIKRMFDIISKWHPQLVNVAQLGEHFDQDRSNFSKQVSDGTLALRLLVEILVRSKKDFPDLVHASGEKLLSPARVAELKLLGLRAALVEYRRITGPSIKESAAKSLDCLDVIILKALHQSNKLDCDSWEWIDVQRKRPESNAALIASALEKREMTTKPAQVEHLNKLREEWRLAVPEVLGLLFDFQ